MATSKHSNPSENEKTIDNAPAPQERVEDIASVDNADNINDTNIVSIDDSDNSPLASDNDGDVDNTASLDELANVDNADDIAAKSLSEKSHYKAKRARDLTPKDESIKDNTELSDKDTDLSVPTRPTTLDDIDDDPEDEIDYNERVKIAMENNPQEPCKRDKARDEKISKISSYGCIPFFLVSIGFSLFNIGRVRHPESFLFLSLAATVLCVGNILRYRNNKKCNCSVCETQGRTLRNTAIIWLVASIGLMIAFVVFLVIKK